MTVLEGIHEFDSLKPNSFSQEQKLRWLDRLDQFLQKTVLDRYPLRKQALTLGDLQRELLLESPFSEGYLYWLEAKVRYFSQDVEGYNGAMGMFRGILEDWQRELHRREKLDTPEDFRF